MLNCSTQPIMYHFATIGELKKTAYEKKDKYHTEYLMNIPETQEDVMLEIGLNYIRFAIEEPNLFRFLFQSGLVVENNLLEMIDSEELTPVISAMQEKTALNIEQTKEIFVTLALFVHGYASIIANNSFEYDEKLIVTHLKRVYTGEILYEEEMKNLKFDEDNKKSTVLTLIGMITMILLTVTKVIPSSKIAGYSMFVWIVFFFITEAVAKAHMPNRGCILIRS